MREDDTRESVNRLLDTLYTRAPIAHSGDAVSYAAILDLPVSVVEVFEHVPKGRYHRAQYTEQLNSIICARGLGSSLGTFD